MIALEETILDESTSLCPECLTKIKAKKYIEEGKVYLKKRCEDHGSFNVLISDDSDFYQEMENFDTERVKPSKTKTDPSNGCPYDCGLCTSHKQHTCIAVLEVTERCNMNCSICFANSNSKSESVYEPDLPKIKSMFQTVKDYSDGHTLVQISGGEPTLRDDLPEIIATGRKVGIKHIELNTTGKRIAENPSFFNELAEEGIDALYLAFDGVSDEVYQKRYGMKLLEKKEKAIERCKEEGIGVVLVPVLAKGYNLDQVGDIIEFAKRHVPPVRGVHFQPMTLFGRYPDWAIKEDRVTIAKAVQEIEKQTGGELKAENFTPTSCPNVHCDVSSLSIVNSDMSLFPLTHKSLGVSGEITDIAEKTKSSVIKRWKGETKSEKPSSECCEPGTWGEFVQRAMHNYLTISIMDFQDAKTFEVERSKECCIHVVTPDERLIPFCNFNLTKQDGSSLYRGEIYANHR